MKIRIKEMPISNCVEDAKLLNRFTQQTLGMELKYF